MVERQRNKAKDAGKRDRQNQQEERQQGKDGDRTQRQITDFKKAPAVAPRAAAAQHQEQQKPRQDHHSNSTSTAAAQAAAALAAVPNQQPYHQYHTSSPPSSSSSSKDISRDPAFLAASTKDKIKRINQLLTLWRGALALE
ncbi:hypothetical protein ACSSS7_006716 [Eimeria intestinalis]